MYYLEMKGDSSVSIAARQRAGPTEELGLDFRQGQEIFSLLHMYQTGTEGRAIAQAVNRCLLTAAARVRVRVWPSGICGGQNGAGAGFLRVLRFSMPIFIPPNSPSS
jgi:hypothetical protein